MTLNRYQRITDQVHAIQWTGSNELKLDEFTNGRFVAMREPLTGVDPEATGILRHLVGLDGHPATGWCAVYSDDWILRDLMGNFHAISDRSFRLRYEFLGVDPPIEDPPMSYVELFAEMGIPFRILEGGGDAQ